MAGRAKNQASGSGLFGSGPSLRAFGAPGSPRVSPATDTSGSSGSSFSPTPQATTGSASQGTSYSGLFSRAPQVPSTSQATATSGLSSSSPFSSVLQDTGTPKATTTSNLFSSVPQDTGTPQATTTSGLFSRAPQDAGTSRAPVASRKIPEMAPKQSPPIPFDRFASSEIFTVRVGTDLQAFHIHKDLLAGLSDEMRNYVGDDTKEGQEVGVEMRQVSPDTMRRFMEFCYSGDYLYTSSSGSNSDDLLKDKDTTEALPLLLTHARLYVFADMFNIVSLKELSKSKIIALTPSFGQLEDRAHALAMISLMDYVLKNIPATTEAPDKLVKFLARYAGYLIEELGGYPEFHALLAGSIREDFFKVFCRWVKAGQGGAPWTDAE